MTEQTLLKDYLGREQIELLAQVIYKVWPDFSVEKFVREVSENLVDLALKQRVSHIIYALAQTLPADYTQTADILIRSGEQLKKVNQKAWSEFIAWPLIDYVAEYGQHDVERSMRILESLTSLFTAEFAIRPFIKEQFALVYPYLEKWVESEDEHLRRLASEAMRPRLPWGEHLKALLIDPTPIFPLLEQLKDDKSLYVRKSVANNLNDISKDHPELILSLCRKWQQGASPEREWIIKHALRTLIKQGHPQVFSLLGFSEKLGLEIERFRLDKEIIYLGEAIKMSLSLTSTSTQKQSFVLDYRVNFVLAGGKQGAKVYKWREIALVPSQQLVIEKQHAFKVMSTRRFYAGIHTIELLLNGVVFATLDLELRL